MWTNLREELQKANPELYSAYERSSDIALNQWLPNISPKKDSYNSYPHLRGVEYHLNEILRNINSDCSVIRLNSTEIYVLLCSVLLHDIGKTIPESDDHAIESERIIDNNWATLEIVSKRIAIIIALICRFHDCTDENANKRLIDVFYVDRYEPIRGRKLGALLILADHLDNTFSRVVPDYIVTEAKRELDIVGAFRSKIQSVRIDFSARMVRTIIDKNDIKSIDIKGEKNITGALYDYLEKDFGTNTETSPSMSNLFIIAGDTARNHLALQKIRNELYAMNLPLEAWLLECDGKLFSVTEKEKDKTYDTAYALETILDCEYCCNILRAMYNLGGGVFGKSFHSYEKLLNYIREDIKNSYKVGCAVRRLSMLLEYDPNGKAECGMNIYCDNAGWRIEALFVNRKCISGNSIRPEDIDTYYTLLESQLKGKAGEKIGIQ